jgi:hypothetical protein
MAIVPDLSGNNRGHNPSVGVTDKHLSRIVSVKRSYPVTPSDTVDLPQGVTEGISVGSAGNVKVTYGNGVVDTVYVAAGGWSSMNVIRIWNSGTTAGNINAGY